MDAQLRRGMLEACVLTALRPGDSYGYQIIKDLSGCVTISESTLYPILKRLESAGCLNEYAVAHNGRLRKFYHLTDSGQQRVKEFLAEWQGVMDIYQFIERGWQDE